MKSWLTKQGGKLNDSDVARVALLSDEAITNFVDLTLPGEGDQVLSGADTLDAADTQSEKTSLTWVRDSQLGFSVLFRS
jgi:hypothetical protein